MQESILPSASQLTQVHHWFWKYLDILDIFLNITGKALQDLKRKEGSTTFQSYFGPAFPNGPMADLHGQEEIEETF